MEPKLPTPNPQGSQTTTQAPHRLESDQILRGRNAVQIDHAGQRYLLRVTRENKLILTK